MSLCTMCEEAPATTTWGLPVCQPCADDLSWLQGELKEMEAKDPELAEAGRRVEEAHRRLRREIDLGTQRDESVDDPRAETD